VQVNSQAKTADKTQNKGISCSSSVLSAAFTLSDPPPSPYFSVHNDHSQELFSLPPEKESQNPTRGKKRTSPQNSSPAPTKKPKNTSSQQDPRIISLCNEINQDISNKNRYIDYKFFTSIYGHSTLSKNFINDCMKLKDKIKNIILNLTDFQVKSISNILSSTGRDFEQEINALTTHAETLKSLIAKDGKPGFSAENISSMLAGTGVNIEKALEFICRLRYSIDEDPTRSSRLKENPTLKQRIEKFFKKKFHSQIDPTPSTNIEYDDTIQYEEQLNSYLFQHPSNPNQNLEKEDTDSLLTAEEFLESIWNFNEA
jgi:hypothetical protein